MRLYLVSILSFVLFIDYAFAQSTENSGSLTEKIEKLKVRPSKWSTSVYIGNWGSITAFDSGPKNQSFSDFFIEQKKDIGKGQSLGLRVHAQQYERSDENSDKVVLVGLI